MVRLFCFVVAVLACSTSLTCAFVPAVRNSATFGLRMAIDYNDPLVAEEFAQVQPMAFEDVETELSGKGIPVPPTMKYVQNSIFATFQRATTTDQTDQILFSLFFCSVKWKLSLCWWRCVYDFLVS
jgi:hypothetical protein